MRIKERKKGMEATSAVIPFWRAWSRGEQNLPVAGFADDVPPRECKPKAPHDWRMRIKERKKEWKRQALSFLFGALGGTRTPDLLVRSQSLYPAELQAHIYFTNTASGLTIWTSTLAAKIYYHTPV